MTEALAHLDEFGQRWRLVRAGQGVADRLGPGGHVDIGYFVEFMSHHVHPDEVTRFLLAVESEPGFTADDAFGLVEEITQALYGMGLPSLLYLWSRWPRRRHVTHGRLVAGGNSSGVNGLDLYDVACLMWAEDEDLVSATDMTRSPPERIEELTTRLMGGDGGLGAAESEVQALRDEMGGSSPSGRVRVTHTANDTKADVDGMAEAMRTRSE